MAKNDFKHIGQVGANLPVRVAASATRGYVGEPIMVVPTYTAGVSNVNTVVVLTNGKPTIGTDQYLGLLHEDMDVNSSGTVLAHRNNVETPIPNCTRTRGKVITAATADTEAEAIGLLFDIYMMDLTGTTYSFEPAGADTAGFTARWYNVTNSELDCIVDERAMRRADVT